MRRPQVCTLRLGTILLFLTLAAVPPDPASAAGALTQPASPGGCVSNDGSGGDCADGVALAGASGVAISADGKHVYAAANNSDAVVILVRNKTTGVLTQPASPAGCVGELPMGGLCADGTALVDARGVAVSPDGKHVYVAAEGSDAISAFKRNKSTGALTQLLGTDACVNLTGGGCVAGLALDGARNVAISPDGRHVYVAAFESDAVAAFARNKVTGVLTQLPGASACVSTVAGPCTPGKGLDGAFAVAITADGKHVYVASRVSSAVAIFTRDKDTGALSQAASPAGCVSHIVSADCQSGVGLDFATAVAVSRDGKHVYVASLQGDAVAVFSRNRNTGGLTQAPSPEGCVSNTGSGGACADGTGLLGASSVTVSYDGRHVYVGSSTVAATGGDAIAVFERHRTTGRLTQLSGTSGCVSRDGTGGACATGKGLDNVLSVVVSKDGKHVYSAASESGAVAVFSRE